MSEETSKPTWFNANSILSGVILAVLLWMGNKTASNTDTLTMITTQLPYVNASVAKLETQIGQLVTRAELESRFSEVAAKNAVLDKRLLLLEFEKKKTE
jgi:hypothetical protein